MRELTECVASHASHSRDRTKCYLKLSVFPPDTGVAFCDWQSFGAKGSGNKANNSAERGHPRLEVWESVGSLPGLLQSVAVAVLTSSFWGAVWNISSGKRPRSCQNLGSNSGVPASNLCFFVCFNAYNSSSNAVLASRAAVLSAERPAKVSPVKKELLLSEVSPLSLWYSFWSHFPSCWLISVWSSKREPSSAWTEGASAGRPLSRSLLASRELGLFPRSVDQL